MKHTPTSRWVREVGVDAAQGDGNYNFSTDEICSSCHSSHVLDPVTSVTTVNNWQSFIPTSFFHRPARTFKITRLVCRL